MDTCDISLVLTKLKKDNDIFHNLMNKKIRDILLISSIYDGYILEQEGKLSEQIFSEYHQLNLTSAPKITNVSICEDAIEILKNKNFDMIIITLNLGTMSSFDLINQIRKITIDIPIILLLSSNSDIKKLIKFQNELKLIDRVFVWNGDSKIFLVMIKYVEDCLNVENDTEIGLVQVILLVEDSVKYYSRYLPILYTEIMKQTQKLIEEENLDDIKKVFRMRARPKVLLANTYEEAVKVFNKYKNNILCVISDVKYKKNNLLYDEAGIDLVKYIKRIDKNIPTLLQSSEIDNKRKADDLSSSFIYKDSDSLSVEISEFMINNLGFGDFIIRNKSENEIIRIKNLKDFISYIKIISDESLIYHSKRNHFSTWLLARGEIELARKIRAMNFDNFSSVSEIREFLHNVFLKLQTDKVLGKVINFDENLLNQKYTIIKLSSGFLGGKGRGLAFVNTLLANINFNRILPDLNITIPKTAIIGTDEFDLFIENNSFADIIYGDIDYIKIKNMFLKAKLTETLIKKLKIYLNNIKVPIVVRSSGLFEDFTAQSFSGVYTSLFLPNNSPDFKIRLKNLCDAIKIVYASLFKKSTKDYFDAINYKIEEERMAIIIEEVVGNKYGDNFYPHISGIVQSYNYYPMSYIKPEDGIAIIAVGLGQYVVDGEKSFRFCPKYPNIEFISQEDIFKYSQQHFYAINMSDNNFDISLSDNITINKESIIKARDDGTLDYIASTWDMNSNRIRVGIRKNAKDPLIINFANIVKYNYIPLAKTLEIISEIFQKAMGYPVEIEFSINLENNSKSTLYILQFKPYLTNIDDYKIDIENIDNTKIILHTDKAMGNAKMDDIEDIIFVKIDKFDISKTDKMVDEIEYLNNKFKQIDKNYILIGPGRWGTREKWLGIPVKWSQISKAKVVVETDLEDLVLDASLGSHFFHNITSMGVGYFTVFNQNKDHFINWKWLNNQIIIDETKYFIHTKVKKPINVKIDGRKGIGVIFETM